MLKAGKCFYGGEWFKEGEWVKRSVVEIKVHYCRTEKLGLVSDNKIFFIDETEFYAKLFFSKIFRDSKGLGNFAVSLLNFFSFYKIPNYNFLF